MHTTTTHVHHPAVFDACDLAWMADALAPIGAHLGATHPWAVLMDVYADGDDNFHPILDEPRLVLAPDHPLCATTDAHVGLLALTGALRIPALETMANLARNAGCLIEVLELRDYSVQRAYGSKMRHGCYWRLALGPTGAVAIVPEDSDGHVERNTALGLTLDGKGWLRTEHIGLGSLGVDVGQSAHGALAAAATAEKAATWYAALCGHFYTGAAEGIVWGSPEHAQTAC